MNHHNWMWKCTLLFALLVTGTTAVQAQTTINATIKNIESDNGNIVLFLWSSEDGFPNEIEKAYRIVRVKAREGSIVGSFRNIPAGTYAMSVIHDENSNETMDKNFIGMPAEPVGVLNQNSMGRPKYSTAKFVVKQGQTTANLEIQLMSL